MVIRQLISRYKQFGGLKVVRIYAKMGILWPMVKTIACNPFSRHSYKKAYYKAIGKIEPFLRVQYSPVMYDRNEYYSSLELEHHRRKTIWFCWLQGLDHAPSIVKVCYESLRKYLPDREIIVIDSNNWRGDIDLPDYILQRWENKQIPSAHFTDLIRLQLLIQYGGTWIDSTILCTGFDTPTTRETLEYLDTDLFLFQYTRPGSNLWGGIGNWFITSCTNNDVLLVLRDMLFAYWKDYDCTLDYFIFHLFFSMLKDVYPEQIASMPYGYASNSSILGYNRGTRFDQTKWNSLVSKVSFHKLTYNVGGKVLKDQDNYYNYIIGLYEV